MKSFPDIGEEIQLFVAVGEMPDYAMVMLSIALMDRSLAKAISQFFKAGLLDDDIYTIFDDDGKGPLSSFSAKCKLAFAIGIFGERTRRDLRRMRNVRNAFAHVPHSVNFTKPAISAECIALEASTISADHPLAANYPRTKFWISFLIYWGALRGYNREGKDLLSEKFRSDLS